MSRWVFKMFLAATVLLTSATAHAQQPAQQQPQGNQRRDVGTLKITVVDETGAAIVDSPVRIWSEKGVDRTVQTSQRGINRFRVVDTDTGLISNEVRVRIG